MKDLVFSVVTVLLTLTSWNCYSQKITTAELSQWTLLGQGEVGTWGDQVFIKEAEESKGIMLVSPHTFTPDIIVRYKVLALTPATVIVTMLSMSDKGDTDKLTIPENYDGSIGIWSAEKENYFFAFKNAPHNVTPFVRKNPDPGITLASARENLMTAGIYYAIEVGKQQGKLWLSIDGKRAFEVKDPDPLSGGHLAIRLRGTAGFQAGCLIKEMEILVD